MLKARETVIDYIVAVSSKRILMLCRKCREVSKENLKTKVIVDDIGYIMLGNLLPKHRM